MLSETFSRLILRKVDEIIPKVTRGRPPVIDNAESLKWIFKVCRTGMSRREVSCSASYVTVFRRMQKWTQHNIFEKAYQDVITLYMRHHPTTHYCIDSSYIRNKQGLAPFVGRNHTDRGRKAIKLSGAYGMGCNIIDAGNRRGLPPGLGKGLRNYLARFFTVVATPEHNTSKTCPYCCHTCGPFEELDQVRREKKMEKASSEEERQKASRYSVRSLRRCNNVCCARVLNRDAASAVLIGRRLKEAIHSSPSRDESLALGQDNIERELDNLQYQLTA